MEHFKACIPDIWIQENQTLQRKLAKTESRNWSVQGVWIGGAVWFCAILLIIEKPQNGLVFSAGKLFSKTLLSHISNKFTHKTIHAAVPKKIHIAVSKSFKKNSFCTCLHPCRVFNASKFKSVTQAMLSIIWLVWPATDLQPSHIYHKWWHNIIIINNDKISS